MKFVKSCKLLNKEDKVFKIVSQDYNILTQQNIFTEYLVIELDTSLYIAYNYTNTLGTSNYSCEEVENIYSIFDSEEENSNIVTIKDYICVGHTLAGRYVNQFSFNFPNIISIEQLNFNEKYLKLIQGGNYERVYN